MNGGGSSPRVSISRWMSSADSSIAYGPFPRRRPAGVCPRRAGTLPGPWIRWARGSGELVDQVGSTLTETT
ncbi:hypothetical protein P3T26_001248 [Streptomyces sp. MAA16]|nr:hypothetical protein [Streptomyces sp. MAA16]